MMRGNMREILVAACLSVAAGCGDDDGAGGAGSGASGDDVQVCYDLCEAQDAAEMAGSCPGIGLDSCKGVCDAIAGLACWSELKALNACQLTGTFDCGLFSAESDAECTSELGVYNSCASASNACTGADDNGRCPAVPCACPDGNTMISGSSNEGGQCACLDSQTCTELCF